ncbi:MAG TPA: glycoside hydrolase family 2 TIM barrel-domain containing protein [Tepidisphaeraceae bacterium]|nr:glycoside hydrolase family 2 TIM barrel-domain containing protein [Tepidisphaeraceae bacterium]
MPLNLGWRFVQQDDSGAAAAGFDDSSWRMLDLPHDWSIEGEYRQDNPAGGAGAYLPCGVGWYRRAIEIPPQWTGKRVFIEFDAAQRNSDVWINGRHLGHRPYGYISFGYDLTPHLKPGQNLLAVRVDNSKLPAARWYTGSGIYSHVRLIVTDKVHIPQWGTFVTTPQVSAQRAEAEVATEVVNDSAERAVVVLSTRLVDANGREIAASVSSRELEPGARELFRIRGLTLSEPKLWSPDSPYLYRLVQQLTCDDRMVDEVTTMVGFRPTRFDADTGFWLNGTNVKLKGVGMHYDAGPMGVAIPDEILERRLKQLKAMGCNAVRTGHTPFPPTFYDLCDRLGLMVMNEVFDGWRRKAAHDYGATAFDEWWQRDLTDWVRRDRNHPSVIIWSIGNETGESDRFGMTKIIHELDPTRPTTGGQVLHGVDVSGFNGPGESPGVLEQFRREHPNQPIVLTEEPHGYQTRGFYKTLTWWRDDNPDRRYPFPPYSTEEVFKYGGDPQHNSSYDNATVRISSRQCWKRTRDTPWISGEFRWAGFDYLGEGHIMGRRWPARYWHPGLHDTAGFPKDTSQFYRSQWTSEPMVHLLPHWTHPLIEPGTKIPMVAYSNCEEVELLLNGRSLGRQKPREELLDFVWQVPYEPGDIEAVAYRGGTRVASTSVRTANAPARIELEMDEPELTVERGDVGVVTFSVIDERGELVPWAEDRIEFKLNGPAQLLGYENGNNVDVTPHRAGYRNVFHGLGRGFFRGTGQDGPIELTAAAILGNRLFQESTTVAMHVERLALRGPLAPAQFEVRYTTDSSQPTPGSARYESPLMLSSPTNVRMLVLRDGQPLLTSEAKFEQGMPPVIVDPRYQKTPTTAPAEDFAGKPRDGEVAGVWSDGKRQLRFTLEGTVVRRQRGEETEVATWWYDFPNDVFEDAADVGAGAIRWADSGQVSRLKLVDREGRELLILTDGRTRKLRRAEE